MKRNKIRLLYKGLSRKYGKPKEQWKLWCQRPKTKKEKEEIIIEAVLTRQTRWQNVEKAVNQLKKSKKSSLASIYNLGKNNLNHLEKLIKSSGFYRQKAYYLFKIAQFFCEKQGLDKIKKEAPIESRKSLLELPGVGPETADSILLYALEKPVFLIDEYTKRFSKRHKLTKNLSYDFLQKLFEKNLKKDYRLYQDFHALIVIEEKNKKF